MDTGRSKIAAFQREGWVKLKAQHAMTRDDWKLRKMPKSRSTIRVSRRFSAREIEKIKLGFRPPDMDYKWFIFFEQARLYIHRSWTGYCIYIVRFENEGRDYVACEVRANRNPKQYGVSDDSYDAQMAFWVIDCILLGRKDARMPISDADGTEAATRSVNQSRKVFMWIPKEIGRIATRLKEGHRVKRITVRELLRMFRAERRGLNKVNDIRVAMDSLGLMTDPDFESAWIDALVRIRLKTSDNVQSGVPTLEKPETAEGGEMAEALSSTEEQEGTRKDWIFPIAEGVCVDDKNGRWSDEAFFDDEDIPNSDALGESVPVLWHQAEPAPHVQDREVWKRWLEFLETSPSAAETLLMVAKSRARAKVEGLA